MGYRMGVMLNDGCGPCLHRGISSQQTAPHLAHARWKGCQMPLCSGCLPVVEGVKRRLRCLGGLGITWGLCTPASWREAAQCPWATGAGASGASVAVPVQRAPEDGRPQSPEPAHRSAAVSWSALAGDVLAVHQGSALPHSCGRGHCRCPAWAQWTPAGHQRDKRDTATHPVTLTWCRDRSEPPSPKDSCGHRGTSAPERG